MNEYERRDNENEDVTDLDDVYRYEDERYDDADVDELQPSESKPESCEPEQPPESLGKKIWEWVKVLVLAVIIGLLITQFVIQRNTVSGVSMLPTLQPADELIVEKVSKWFGGVARGDIITVHKEDPSLRDGEANIIKRVIGLPGERVEVHDGVVFIDGVQLEEPYLAENTQTTAFKEEYANILLGDDEYYVMGDNRPQSLDSRRFGSVKKSDIIGEVLVRIWPFNAMGSP